MIPSILFHTEEEADLWRDLESMRYAVSRVQEGTSLTSLDKERLRAFVARLRSGELVAVATHGIGSCSWSPNHTLSIDLKQRLLKIKEFEKWKPSHRYEDKVKHLCDVIEKLVADQSPGSIEEEIKIAGIVLEVLVKEVEVCSHL